jgi:YHS domain-containing protein
MSGKIPGGILSSVSSKGKTGLCIRHLPIKYRMLFFCDTIDSVIGNKYLVFSLLLVLTVLSCDSTSRGTPINSTSEGIAIKGYDPVAYFTVQRPVKGSEEYEYSWKGAVWLFASAEDRDLFRADPEKYAPKYGGYCAYAVSQGKLADIDPASWTVFQRRLYLNLNKDVQNLWARDMEEYIRRADENWPRMLAKKR